MKYADLYLDEMRWEAYVPEDLCRKCGSDSCRDLIEKIANGECTGGVLDGLSPETRRALKSALSIRGNLPEVPQLSTPRAGKPGLTRLNDPKRGDPVLVTGNNVFTQEVLITVLSGTSMPLFFLSADTRGDSLDMAVILGTFTPAAVVEALDSGGLSDPADPSPLLLPGKAVELADAVAERTNREVEVGPVCAVELPFYFGDRW